MAQKQDGIIPAQRIADSAPRLHLVGLPEERRLDVVIEGLRSPVASRQAFTAPIFANLFDVGRRKGISAPGRAAAPQQAGKRPRCPVRPAA